MHRCTVRGILPLQYRRRVAAHHGSECGVLSGIDGHVCRGRGKRECSVDCQCRGATDSTACGVVNNTAVLHAVHGGGDNGEGERRANRARDGGSDGAIAGGLPLKG